MKRLPIELAITTKTTKVSPKAWERAIELKEQFGVRLQDVVSACLLYMPAEELEKIFARQSEMVAAMPKPVQGMLKNLDKLSDEDKAMLREMLSEG